MNLEPLNPLKYLEYIILSLALALPVLLTLRDSADKVRLRLSRGLLVSLLLAAEQVLLILLGMYLGNLLRFDIPEYDTPVFLGLFIVVAIRMFITAFRKTKKADAPVFDISRWPTVLLMGIATGTNALFVGLGLGFRASLAQDVWAVAIPLLVAVFLFSYLGIMLGRQHKALRPRRWLLIAVLFLLVYAIKCTIDT